MRYSKQREAIRTYMEGRHDHPTADSVYAAVREELPNMHTSSVMSVAVSLMSTDQF